MSAPLHVNAQNFQSRMDEAFAFLNVDKYKDIPEELKALLSWVNYLRVPKLDKQGNPVLKANGKPKTDKIPFNPAYSFADKRNASTTDSRTWGTFEQAVANENGFSGIGFVFDGNGICGLDIDDCIVNDELAEWAKPVLTELNSYAEYSQSDDGVHGVFLGELPGSGIHIGSAEMYDRGRFFAFTGKRLEEYPAKVRAYDCAALYKRIKAHEFDFSKPTKPASKEASSTAPSNQIRNDSGPVSTNKTKLLMTGVIESQSPFRVSDDKGNYIDYPSQSETDQALCNCLAFRHDGDAGKIDAEFRKSVLMREDWDRKSKYTLQSAVEYWRDHAPAVPASSVSVNSNEPEITLVTNIRPDMSRDVLVGRLGEIRQQPLFLVFHARNRDAREKIIRVLAIDLPVLILRKTLNL